MTDPDPFRVDRSGRLTLLLRRDVAGDLTPLLRAWSAADLPAGRPLFGGRGGVALYDSGALDDVVLRPCRRGGAVAKVNRDVYLGIRPRPFREVRNTETLRRRGVPTVEMLGAAVHWLLPGCYRAAVASSYVTGAVNLWQYLRRAAPDQRAAACAAAAAATRVLHDEGGVHPDLNLQNYLVRRHGDDVQAMVIDCDRIVLRRVEGRDRRAAFERICRSIRRLDPDSAVLTAECIDALSAIVEA